MWRLHSCFPNQTCSPLKERSSRSRCGGQGHCSSMSLFPPWQRLRLLEHSSGPANFQPHWEEKRSPCFRLLLSLKWRRPGRLLRVDRLQLILDRSPHLSQSRSGLKQRFGPSHFFSFAERLPTSKTVAVLQHGEKITLSNPEEPRIEE